MSKKSSPDEVLMFFLTSLQMKSMGRELLALRSVVKCIKDHQLELEYPPQQLYPRINQLERQLAQVRSRTTARVFKPQKNQENSTRAESQGKMKTKPTQGPALAQAPSHAKAPAPTPASVPAPAPTLISLTESNQKNATRTESKNQKRKRLRYSATQDFSSTDEKHWQHFRKRPRAEPLAEAPLNPVDILHESSQLIGGPYSEGHYTEREQPCAEAYHGRHYSTGNWIPPVMPSVNHFEYMPNPGLANDHIWGHGNFNH